MARKRVTCVDSTGYPSIRTGRSYDVVADPGGLCKGGIAIVDDTGRVALYPRTKFYDKGT